ncbi:MAG: prepilin-type N-terminal cleavage/methylation domain-containing protein [Armatimonadetes bacterium]|nr:prepilin-type N-terminal cleavage/methylation domain-containing protein [Armatimonadota bacterium]
MKRIRSARAAGRRARGFTLVEVLVATVLASLLMMGTMDLYMTSARTTLKVNARVAASQDAANAVQQVIQLTREAQSFSLPSETTFVVPTGLPAGSYQTSLGGEPIYAALELLQPATTATTVTNTAGVAVPIAPLNRQGAGAARLLFYRADADGTPDANAGKCLWEYSVQDSGASVNRAVCKSIDAGAPNAVQFVRPVVMIGSPPTAAAQPHDLEVKVISSYYSLDNGQQTNEETNGSDTSQLSGKCVLMRDSDTSPAPGGATTNPGNNAFRFH